MYVICPEHFKFADCRYLKVLTCSKNRHSTPCNVTSNIASNVKAYRTYFCFSTLACPITSNLYLHCTFIPVIMYSVSHLNRQNHRNHRYVVHNEEHSRKEERVYCMLFAADHNASCFITSSIISNIVLCVQCLMVRYILDTSKYIHKYMVAKFCRKSKKNAMTTV